MNTQTSSKLAALAVALMMNSLIFGSVAYLFNGRIHQTAARTSFDRALAESEAQPTREAA
jgi:hypothetical protein